MPTPKRFTGRLALAAAAALATPLLTAAPSASAGDVNWRVTVGNHGGHHRGGGYHDSGRRGYYKSVWHPPVYRTYYDDCGRAIRKCVRRGYYERVWVSAPRRHYTYGNSTYHNPRHQRYDRWERRRGCSRY